MTNYCCSTWGHPGTAAAAGTVGQVATVVLAGAGVGTGVGKGRLGMAWGGQGLSVVSLGMTSSSSSSSSSSMRGMPGRQQLLATTPQ
jgi:hypothetical protein